MKAINSGKGQLALKTTGLEDKLLKDLLADVFIYQHNVAYWEDVFNTATINARIIVKELSNVSPNNIESFIQ